MARHSKRNVWLVQQGVWDMPVESMPLAMGYLKATVDSDHAIRSEVDARILNFRGGDTAQSIVQRLFDATVPDIVAFSVFGWNYHTYGVLAETFKQLNPAGWIIYGGTHVAHQSRRVFGMYPAVDVVVNGEGEFVFSELVRAYLAGKQRHELNDIDGISFKDPDGGITTTPARARIHDLDSIPSPFLSGAIEMNGPAGQFKYDVALMETNRGCPYKCSFCYWGGATGQKLRVFSRERLQEELDFFGRNKVVNLVLCDANFGILEQDLQFMEDLIATREKYGFPRTLETSWTKNKSKTFHAIVRRMKQTGLRSSFTLALQTLDDAVLDGMQRTNMKVNEWESLASWLTAEGLECYAELIWGAPGETYESFVEGYDRLAKHVSHIAIYPLLLLPNTHYADHRDDYGLITLRGDKDDFEYVLANRSISIDDNRKMMRFLFWARVVAENMIFRHIWAPLRELAGFTQSQVLLSLDRWFARQDDESARRLRSCQAEMVDNLDASRVASGIAYFYLKPHIDALLERWWAEEILPQVPVGLTPFFRELVRYDLVTRPIYSEDDQRLAAARTELVQGETYYVLVNQQFTFDIPRLVAHIKHLEDVDLTPHPLVASLYFKAGFRHYVANHEFVVNFVGKTWQQLLDEGFTATGGHHGSTDASRDSGVPRVGVLGHRVSAGSRATSVPT